jgi:hypothetical protein
MRRVVPVGLELVVAVAALGGGALDVGQAGWVEDVVRVVAGHDAVELEQHHAGVVEQHELALRARELVRGHQADVAGDRGVDEHDGAAVGVGLESDAGAALDDLRARERDAVEGDEDFTIHQLGKVARVLGGECGLALGGERLALGAAGVGARGRVAGGGGIVGAGELGSQQRGQARARTHAGDANTWGTELLLVVLDRL